MAKAKTFRYLRATLVLGSLAAVASAGCWSTSSEKRRGSELFSPKISGVGILLHHHPVSRP